MVTLTEQFAAEIASLCATTVTPRQWQAFLDSHVPRMDPTGQPPTGRSLTLAQNKRDTLEHLYQSDARVAPWAGTAHGVIQAANTYATHEATVRGETEPSDTHCAPSWASAASSTAEPGTT